MGAAQSCSAGCPTGCTGRGCLPPCTPPAPSRSCKGRGCTGEACHDRLVANVDPPLVRRGMFAFQISKKSIGCDAYSSRTLALDNNHGPAQYRHHRPCRSRQDDAGRLSAAPERYGASEPADARSRPGPWRARTRAWHHDPRQVYRDPLARRAHRHRRHPRPRGLRRRSRTRARHGRRCARPGGRGRRSDASDQVRGRQGAPPRPTADRRDQQNGSPRRSARGRTRSGLRSVRRIGSHGQATRFSSRVQLGAPRLGLARPGYRWNRYDPALRGRRCARPRRRRRIRMRRSAC